MDDSRRKKSDGTMENLLEAVKRGMGVSAAPPGTCPTEAVLEGYVARARGMRDLESPQAAAEARALARSDIGRHVGYCNACARRLNAMHLAFLAEARGAERTAAWSALLHLAHRAENAFVEWLDAAGKTARQSFGGASGSAPALAADSVRETPGAWPESASATIPLAGSEVTLRLNRARAGYILTISAPATEQGFSHLIVTLRDARGNPVRSEAGHSGAIRFSRLTPQAYRLEITRF